MKDIVFTKSTFTFGILLGQNMTMKRLVTANLTLCSPPESLGRSPVTLHFRHEPLPLLSPNRRCYHQSPPNQEGHPMYTHKSVYASKNIGASANAGHAPIRPLKFLLRRFSRPENHRHGSAFHAIRLLDNSQLTHGLNDPVEHLGGGLGMGDLPPAKPNSHLSFIPLI